MAGGAVRMPVVSWSAPVSSAVVMPRVALRRTVLRGVAPRRVRRVRGGVWCWVLGGR